MRYVFLICAVFLFSCKQEKTHKVDKNIAFGIDVSQYQGVIDWKTVASQKKHPIEFVFIRATMGKNRKDKKFQYNWKEAKKNGFIVGAYHYYDPNEHSITQARNYLETATVLKPGDFIPVVDIEQLGKRQSVARLRLGLRRWLTEIEKVYGVKPIIYTGHAFFKDHLLDEFKEYPLWVAAYSQERREDAIVQSSIIHQFSEKVTVPGIRENKVDGNDIRREHIQKLLLK